jgi:NADPH:quinone reductase-like Zn-dependent oxidoreductase
MSDRSIHATVVDPAAPGRLVIREVPSPQPLPNQLLVGVKARLKPHIDVEVSWNKVAEITQQLMDRKFTGKAVLAVD